MREAVRHDSSVSIVTGQWAGHPSVLRSTPESEMLILGPSSHMSNGHWGLFCARLKNRG